MHPDGRSPRRISRGPSYSSSMAGSRLRSVASNARFHPPVLSSNMRFDVILIDNMSYISSDESHGTVAAELMPRQLSHNAPGQMNALLDSLTDDDEGDVKDTLRRLEGHINPKEQQEKMTKVEGWVRTIHDCYIQGNEESHFPVGDDELDEAGGQHDPDGNKGRDGSVPAKNSMSSYNSGNGDVQRISVVSASSREQEQEADIAPSLPVSLRASSPQGSIDH
jgi:hypothetical protein